MFSSHNGLVYMWPKSNTQADMEAGFSPYFIIGRWKHGDSGFDHRLVGGLNEEVLYSASSFFFCKNPITSSSFCVLKKNTDII